MNNSIESSYFRALTLPMEPSPCYIVNISTIAKGLITMPDTSTDATIQRLSSEPGPQAKFREEYYRTRTTPKKAKQPTLPATGVDPLFLERIWMRLAQSRLIP